MRDDDEDLWETPAAGVRRLRNRGGDGFRAEPARGADDWEQFAGAYPLPAPDDFEELADPTAQAAPHSDSADFAQRAPSNADLGQAEGRLADFARAAPHGDAADFAQSAPRRDSAEYARVEPHRISFDSALATLAAPPRPRRRVPRKLLAVLALILLALLAALLLTSRRSAWPPPDWIFAACDVGQGDALVLADGPHTALVVDTGPDPAKEDHCLTDLGITHVRLLLLTHFHADHIDGVPGVVDHRAVDEIETTILDDPPEGAAKVAAWAGAGNIPVSRAMRGEHRAYGPVSWDVLWPDPALLGAANAPPPAGGAKRSRRGSHSSSRRSGGQSKGGSGKSEEGSAPNNASIVLHVRVATADGPVTLLLTGDIEPPAQQAIIASTPDLAADIFKVPHHGSAHQDPDLVARVHPRAAVISVGKGNTYGHPAPRTLTLAVSTGAKVFRTDDDGTVLVVGPASRLHVVLHP